jgi:short-subunit dehydrogenase
MTFPSRQNRVVCAFGWGTLLEQCFAELSWHLGGAPDLICDNAPAKWGQTLKGVSCISPQQLAEMKNVVAVIGVRNFAPIVAQLKSYGIEDIFLIIFERSAYRITNLVSEPYFADAPKSVDSDIIRSKWSLITGASRGLGMEIAIYMARIGSNVILHARHLDHLEKVYEFCSQHVKAEMVAAELHDPAQIDTMLRQIESLGIPVSYVFNNAAYSPPVERLDGFSIPDHDFEDCFYVNTLAPIKIIKSLLPKMVEQNFGRIVNISSGIQFKPETAAYAVSKAGLDKFVGDLCPKLAGTDVSMVLVDPGGLSTDMTGHIGQPIETAFPGVVLAALADSSLNGKWLFAQDYRGMNIEAALQRAALLTQF